MFEKYRYRNNGEFRLGEVRDSVGYLTADTWQKEIRIQICVAMDGGWISPNTTNSVFLFLCACILNQ